MKKLRALHKSPYIVFDIDLQTKQAGEIEMIPQPTKKEEKIFIKQTVKHIKYVQSNMKKIALYGGFLGVSPIEIMRRLFLHDSSKFDNDKYIGYIWYNYRNRARERGKKEPVYSDELNNYIRECVHNHRNQSRHHPEYYTDVNDMEGLDLIEMVCDWTALSQAHKTKVYKSSRDFANCMFDNVYLFDKQHKEDIFKIIDLLTELNGKEY